MFELVPDRYYAGVWFVRWYWGHDQPDGPWEETWQAMLFRENAAPPGEWRMEYSFRRSWPNHTIYDTDGKPIRRTERNWGFLFRNLTQFKASSFLDALANRIIRRTSADFHDCIRVEGDHLRFLHLLEHEPRTWFSPAQGVTLEAPPPTIHVEGLHTAEELPMPGFMREFDDRPWD